jgi:hypothetical protein
LSWPIHWQIDKKVLTHQSLTREESRCARSRPENKAKLGKYLKQSPWRGLGQELPLSS